MSTGQVIGGRWKIGRKLGSGSFATPLQQAKAAQGATAPLRPMSEGGTQTAAAQTWRLTIV